VPPSKSLKYEERTRREKSGKGKSKEYQPYDALPVPEWKNFMQNPNNTANLLNFLGKSWAHQNFPSGCTLILGSVFKDPERTLFVSHDSEARDLPELSCRRHEEADTRMFAYMAYSVQVLGYRGAVVVATDTDVITMCFYYSSQLPGLEQLWMQKMGVYVPVHAAVAGLAEKYETKAAHLMSVLLSVYVMTRCDTVSFPWHRGKRRAFRLATENLEELTPIARYGQPGEDLHVTEDVMDAARSNFGGLLMLYEPICSPTLRGTYVVFRQKLVAKIMLKLPKPLHSNAKYCNCLRGCLCSNAKVMCVIACRCEGDASKCSRVKDTLDEF